MNGNVILNSSEQYRTQQKKAASERPFMAFARILLLFGVIIAFLSCFQLWKMAGEAGKCNGNQNAEKEQEKQSNQTLEEMVSLYSNETPFEPEIVPVALSLEGSSEVEILIVTPHANETFGKIEGEKSVFVLAETLESELQKEGIRATVLSIDGEESKSAFGSYERAKKDVLQELKGNPKMKLVVDLHIGNVDSISKTERGSTRLRLIVGTYQIPGDSVNQNFSLAQLIRKKIEKKAADSTEPVALKNRTYLQNLSVLSVRVELGTYDMTEEEAKNSLQVLAKALSEIGQAD